MQKELNNSLKIYHQSFSIKTRKVHDFIDITTKVQDIVTKSGIQNGQVLVFSYHTTAAIFINENEPLLIEDMKLFLNRLADPKNIYKHNDVVSDEADEHKNGHSHCQHIVLSPSTVLPLIANQICLGKYQRVFFIELDESRERKVLIQIMGK